MTVTTDRYINLFTDFGFKKLFGEQPNKELLISFLNELLDGKEKIQSLSYLKNERLGRNEGERKAVYDLYCTNERGDKFIVEIQRVKQEFFKDRSVYYSSFAIQEQALKGRDWKYELAAVYTIAILDFTFDDSEKDKFEHRVQLMDVKNKKVFFDKLTFLYIEIPKFEKELHELSSDYERWLYAFKHLHKLREQPKELEQGVFKKLFELAELANMDEKERMIYEESLKDYWDLKSAIETYFKEGKEEGREEGRKEGRKEGWKESLYQTALNAIKEGLGNDIISKLTGLTEDELNKLRQENE